MYENQTNSDKPMELVQKMLPDDNVEVIVVNDDIASVSSNNKSGEDKVMSHSELGEGYLSEDESEIKGRMATHHSALGRGRKRRRDIDDVGGSSKKDDADVSEIEDWIDRPEDTTSDHMCWIKNAHDYRAIQIRNIRAKHNASELFRCMNDNNNNLTRSDNVCYRRWWLATATKHNHISLVCLLLEDRVRYDMNNGGQCVGSYATHCENECHFGRPFYMAIKSGQRSLVWAFLLAGASVTDLMNDIQYDIVYFTGARYDPTIVYDISCQKYIHETVSALEYAFIVDQPGVVKLLLDHFNSQYPRWDQVDTSWTRCIRRPLKPLECITSPLHVIMKLATQFYGSHLTRLPSFVQQIINAGGDVNFMDRRGNAPLLLLMKEIRLIAPLDENGIAYRNTVTEITKTLLKAGSAVNALQLERSPLEVLTKFSFPSNFALFPSAVRDHLQFVNDLVKLLILNGADLALSKFYVHVPHVAAMLLNTFRGDLVCDEMLNSLSNMIRIAILAGANSLTEDHWRQFLDNSCFICSFVQIAEYSSHPDHSEKLMFTILNALGANNLRKLTDMLKTRRKDVATHSHPFYSVKSVDDAIRYVDGVGGAPRSLKDLSRQAIARAMSVETLLGASSVDLGLPTMLEKFILLQ